MERLAYAVLVAHPHSRMEATVQPPPSWRDVLWATFAAAAAAWFLSAIVDAGVIVGTLLVVAGVWVVAGAWRRTVWGCPFSHDPHADGASRCPRHGDDRRPVEGQPRR